MKDWLKLVALALVSCSTAPPPLVFDGGPCQRELQDGGYSSTSQPCEVPADTCEVPVSDDPCTTTCECGSDAGWSCARNCPALEPCRVGGYCISMTTACETLDGGCTLECGCSPWGRVSNCAVRCP